MLAALAVALAAAGAQAFEEQQPQGPKDTRGLGHQEAAEVAELIPGKPVSALVRANTDEWTHSGVSVRKGQSYRLTAKGEWTTFPLCNRVGPSGEGMYNLVCVPLPLFPVLLQGFTHSALIAKVGIEGKPFAVGEELEFTARDDGALYLRSNDTPAGSWDNTGQMAVAISLAGTPQAAPPPVSAPPAAEGARPGTPAPALPTVPMPLPEAPPPAAASQRWAVVIGVSEYADSRVPSLRYAAADARAFHDWLVSPEGGRFAPSRTRLLLDRDATYSAIKESLFNWLRQAIEEDVVVIYFAGHGSPDSPDTPQNLYLLPHDTRHDSVAATGFPMWDIETALKRFIKARRVIVVADACHSGGVGAQFDIARRSMPDTNVNRISAGLQNLATIGTGIAVLSAGDDKQLSMEGTVFGGGHGVFTWTLLEGLQGKADYNGDRRVTLGEIIPYVSENVRRATLNMQSPTVAGRFDPALSIAR